MKTLGMDGIVLEQSSMGDRDSEEGVLRQRNNTQET